MQLTKWQKFGWAALAGLSLAGCGGGEGETAGTPQTSSPAGGENAAPVITGTPEMNSLAGTPWQMKATATDRDSVELTFGASGLPAWLSLDTRTGLLSGTPTQDDAGTTADITLSVSDGVNTSLLPVFRLTVAALETGPLPPPAVNNQAPTISGAPAASVLATAVYAFMPTAADADSVALRFSVVNKPSWASFSTTTGKLSGTPVVAHVRRFDGIVISVSDGELSTSLPAFSIDVRPTPNQAPSINGAPATTVAAGSQYTFTPAASDPDSPTLGFSIVNKPSWAIFSTSTGQLSGTPGSSASGTSADIRISVSDGNTTTTLPPFSITTGAAVSGAPTISGNPALSVVAGSIYSFVPTAQDAEGDVLTFSISGKPAWASFTASTGKLTGTPTNAQIGSYDNIVITVSDGRSSRALAAFSINVTSPGSGSGTATLSWSAPIQTVDGATLTNLAGYRIYHGSSASALSAVATISSPGISTYVLDALAPGTHYFAVSAMNTQGAESALSAVGSKHVL